MNFEIVIVLLYSYLLGSIPFGLIITKIFLDKDIRNVGSGNIGTTNVLRTGKKSLAVATLLFDILKGYLSVLITLKYFNDLIYFSALICFLAHIFPVWLKFKGGKGVATYLGVLFAISIQLSILFIVTWLVVFLIFKYSSVSSMFSSLTVFIVALIKNTVLSEIYSSIFYEKNIILFLFIFFILIIFTHRKNITNLKNKTEQKIKI